MTSAPMRADKTPASRIDPDLGLERAVEQYATLVAERAREVTGVPDEEVDVKRLRARLGMTQVRFAETIGIPLGTVRNWEQRRRRPEGPARVLLQLIAADPDGALKTLGAGG